MRAKIGSSDARAKAAHANSRHGNSNTLDKPDGFGGKIAVPDDEHGHKVHVGKAEQRSEKQTA